VGIILNYRNMFGKCLYCQSKEHQGRDCKKIVFRKGSCCVSCGFPQKAFGENIHGDVRTGECEKGMRDIMKGICWGVYREKRNEMRVFEELGIKEDINEEEFKKWISEMDVSGEMNNGCRMVLEVWRSRNIY